MFQCLCVPARELHPCYIRKYIVVVVIIIIYSDYLDMKLFELPAETDSY